MLGTLWPVLSKVFGWVSTCTTATSTPTRSRVSAIHLGWHYTKCTGDPWGSPRMGDRLKKSHYVLYFPRLGNTRTSRSLQARYYRFALDRFFLSITLLGTQQSFPTSWFQWMHAYCFLGFFGCLVFFSSRFCLEAKCKMCSCILLAYVVCYTFQVGHPYESP